MRPRNHCATRWNLGPLTLGLLATLLGTIAAGCSPPPPAASTRPTSKPAPDGPRAAVIRVMELHRTRQYTKLRELIVPAHAGDVVTTLMAVDEFMDVNQRLCDWIRDHVGVGLAQTIDQSYIRELLGLFSGSAELLDESVIGNAATVSFCVAGRLPPEQALLRRIDGVWRYDPEEGYTEDLPGAFREMARGLEQALTDLERGQITAAQLRDNPDRLIEKVQVSLRRGVEILSRARAAAGPTSRP